MSVQPLNVTFDASGSILITTTDAVVVTYNPGDIAWVLTSTALVFIMVAGVGFLYSGLLRRKNALSMLYLSMAVYCVVTVEWFFWGYTLAFSETASPFIGNMLHFGLMGAVDAPSPGSAKVPTLVYAIYQGMFAAITPVIAIGGAAERGRLGPLLMFVFAWTTIVYNPVACWVWNPKGWLFILGDLDFAGGGPVHMTSGTAALALGIFLGKRRGYGTERLAYRPHSVSHVVLGTFLLYFGWFGFNGGSALASGFRAAQAAVATNTAAAMGGLTWLMIDYYYSRKWSAVSLCSGVVTGLIGITPAAGYVSAPSALCIGFVSVVGANYATKLKHIVKVDDSLDVFSTHAIGGLIGSILTGVFADKDVTGYDGTVIAGGWVNRNFIQVGYQLASSTAIMGYTFVVTMILLFIIDRIPGCHMRANEEDEIIGIDESGCGESGYDYAYVQRDLEQPGEHIEWLQQKNEVTSGSGAASHDGTPSMKEAPETPEAVVLGVSDLHEDAALRV